MSQNHLISLQELCVHYDINMSFLDHLHELDLITITTIQQSPYVHKEEVIHIEKMIRLHYELNINLEGIDTIFNLLNKIEALQKELTDTKNKLRIYEDKAR